LLLKASHKLQKYSLFVELYRQMDRLFQLIVYCDDIDVLVHAVELFINGLARKQGEYLAAE
jgi:hypothetical protein